MESQGLTSRHKKRTDILLLLLLLLLLLKNNSPFPFLNFRTVLGVFCLWID